MHLVVSYLRPVGPGAVNRNKNGDLKQISMGGTLRTRFSSQKEKSSYRDYLRNNTDQVISIQSRSYGEWVKNELMNRGVKEKKAQDWAISIMHTFLSHNLEKVKEKEEKNKKEEENGKKKKKNPLHTETVRLYPEEQDQILKVVEDLASGKLDDPKKVKFDYKGHALDIAMSGRMRPNSEPGAVSVGHAMSVDTLAKENDFFVARDDFKNESFYTEDSHSTAHMGTNYLSASIMYDAIAINTTDLLKKFDGDVKKTNDAVDNILEAICLYGSRSDSTNGFQTHTPAAYVLVEKMVCAPRSLCTAFEQPVSTVAEAVARIKKYRKSLNAVYQQDIDCKEMFCYTNSTGDVVSGGSLQELKEFAKS